MEEIGRVEDAPLDLINCLKDPATFIENPRARVSRAQLRQIRPGTTASKASRLEPSPRPVSTRRLVQRS